MGPSRSSLNTTDEVPTGLADLISALLRAVAMADSSGPTPAYGWLSAREISSGASAAPTRPATPTSVDTDQVVRFAANRTARRGTREPNRENFMIGLLLLGLRLFGELGA